MSLRASVREWGEVGWVGVGWGLGVRWGWVAIVLLIEADVMFVVLIVV